MHDRLIALRTLHPFPSVLVATLTTAIVPLADRSAPMNRYITLGLGMLLYQFAIGLVNDLVDMRDDRRTKPWKPLARGSVSPPLASVIAIVCATSAVAETAAGLSLYGWLIGLAGFCCGLAYDLYLKRTQFSWLPYAIGVPLIPVWVYTASAVWRPLLWWSIPLGALLGFALHVANEAPDVTEPDTLGLPGRIGARHSRLVAVVLFGAVMCALSGLLVSVSPARALAVLIIGGSVVAMSPMSTQLLGRDGLFGLLAATSGCVALIFLSAI